MKPNPPLITYKWYRTVSFGAIGGLKQWCSLSLLLANIYLSDLDSHLELGHSKAPVLSQSSVTSVTWADDLFIMSVGQEGLQHCINPVWTGLFANLKDWGAFCPPPPHPNLAISCQMTIKLGKDILWVETFTD